MYDGRKTHSVWSECGPFNTRKIAFLGLRRPTEGFYPVVLHWRTMHAKVSLNFVMLNYPKTSFNHYPSWATTIATYDIIIGNLGIMCP